MSANKYINLSFINIPTPQNVLKFYLNGMREVEITSVLRVTMSFLRIVSQDDLVKLKGSCQAWPV